jgi:hypothetical protein
MRVEKTVMITVTGAVPSDVVRFIVTKDGRPVEGAEVAMTSEQPTLIVTMRKKTDANGVADFSIWDFAFNGLYNPITGHLVNPYLVLAYLDDTPYGAWKDSLTVSFGSGYNMPLKTYRTVPTFFLRFYLRDMIGRDLFAQLVASIESFMIGWAGFKVTKVGGVGTNVVTIYFQPKWREASPLAAIAWAGVVDFVKALTVLVIAIIIALVVLRFVFGEAAAPIAWGILLIAGLAVASPIILALISKEGGGKGKGEG